MTWKEFISDYLTFSRKERIGVITVISIILVVFFLPNVFPKADARHGSEKDTAWIADLQKLETKNDNSQQDQGYANENSSNYQYDRVSKSSYVKPGGELFYFDPNKLTKQDWLRLGLREKTINTILNYLNKGGHFRKPEDLQRIYGLFPNEYERIAPYIKIDLSNESFTKSDFNNNSTDPKPAKAYPSKYSIIDINLADTTAYIALPGIGSKLASRIINFRDKLGGFYSINQVGETFGLPDSTFQKIKQYLKLDNILIRQININTATIDELKAHPYIKWSLANPIIAYRKEHGLFSKVEDVKNIMTITDDIYKKIVPYLTLQ